MGSAIRRTAVVITAAAVATVAGLGPAGAAGASEANGSTFLLTGSDAASNVLSGRNAQGFSFSAPYDAYTRFWLADLSRYAAGDPCRDAAADYNEAIGTSGSGDSAFINLALLDSSLDALASGSCYARVILSPGDPYRKDAFPTDPVRQFQPRVLPPSPI